MPLSLTYLRYDLSIEISTFVKYLFNRIYTVWSPSEGMSLLRNAPGKSIVATDLFPLAAIAVIMNTLVVLTVGEELFIL